LKDQPAKAIEVYLEIVKGLEGTPELDDELALYNKVGDLYLRVRNVNAAVEMYERAVNRYAESGFPNNAIALCNKILRSAPGRNHVYLKLAQLMLQRGFVAEAKKNFVEYAERMVGAGKLEEAFNALKQFADLAPENENLRQALIEQLRAAAGDDAAREHLDRLVQGEAGDSAATEVLDGVRKVDPEYDVERPTSRSDDLVFISLDDDAEDDPETVPPDDEVSIAIDTPVVDSPVLELESPGSVADSDFPVTDLGADQLVDLEPRVDFETSTVDGLETVELEPTSVDPGPPPAVNASASAPSPVDSGELEVPELDLVGFEDGAQAEPDVDLVMPEVTLQDDSSVVAIGNETEDPVINLPEGDQVVDATPVEIPSVRVDGATTDPESAEVEAGEGFELTMPEDTTGPAEFFDLTDAHEESGSEDGTDILDIPVEVAEVSEEKGQPVAFLEVASADTEEDALEALEAAVAETPNDPAVRRRYAEALIGAGEAGQGLEELDRTLAAYEAMADWNHASAVAEEILRIEPNSVAHHQKQVEYTYRSGDRQRLARAYLGLANALFRTGDFERAKTVYDRVLEQDPSNAEAREGLGTVTPFLEPAEPAPAASNQGANYVDLGSLIMGDEEQEKDTRMRVQEEEPSGDEQQDFDEMLQQFKRGIEENLDDDDTQAHYDLGVAFKEMGLVDEAIGEFQKSLRGLDTRLQSAEMLGLCFFDKGQFEVASTVLRRAVDGDPGSEQEKVGLLYWLGRCEEEKSHPAEALVHYQRVFAVDISFKDVGRRVDTLVKATS